MWAYTESGKFVNLKDIEEIEVQQTKRDGTEHALVATRNGTAPITLGTFQGDEKVVEHVKDKIAEDIPKGLINAFKIVSGLEEPAVNTITRHGGRGGFA